MQPAERVVEHRQRSEIGDDMTVGPSLQPIRTRATWRGDDGIPTSEYTYELSDAELDELEHAGARFVEADPDLRAVARDDFPLPVCARGIEQWAHDLDEGLGFVLVRGLRVL